MKQKITRVNNKGVRVSEWVEIGSGKDHLQAQIKHRHLVQPSEKQKLKSRKVKHKKQFSESGY